jgi:hypothetical protein
MNQSFFIEPRKATKEDLKERKRTHQKQIIDLYKGWRESLLTIETEIVTLNDIPIQSIT